MTIKVSALSIVLLSLLLGVNCETNESKLVRYLMKPYNYALYKTRPVIEDSAVLQVSIGFNLIRIVDFDEDKEEVTAIARTLLSWRDERLTWNHTEYGGIKLARVSSQMIWTLDISLYNSNTGNVLIDPNGELVLVSTTGDVNWVSSHQFRVPCVPESYHQYNCSFTFGSWTRNGWLVDLDLSGSDILSDLIVNPKWRVMKDSAFKKVKKYPCCPEPYPSVTYSVILKEYGWSF